MVWYRVTAQRVGGYGPSALPLLPPPSPQRHELGARARVAELLERLHAPLAVTLLVAERLNVARINIAVAQTAARSRTPCIVASEEAKSEIAVKVVTEKWNTEHEQRKEIEVCDHSRTVCAARTCSPRHLVS